MSNQHFVHKATSILRSMTLKRRMELCFYHHTQAVTSMLHC
jgi:hypothetical protein